MGHENSPWKDHGRPHIKKSEYVQYFLPVSWTKNDRLRIRHLQNNVGLHHAKSSPHGIVEGPLLDLQDSKKLCAALTVGLLCSSSRLEAISLQLAKSLPTWVQIGCVESKDNEFIFLISWNVIILLEEVHSCRISTGYRLNVSCIYQTFWGTAFILHRNFGHAFCFHNLWRELAVGSPCDDLNMHVRLLLTRGRGWCMCIHLAPLEQTKKKCWLWL